MKNIILPEQEAKLITKLKELSKGKSPLIPSIHYAQEIFSGVPLEVQKIIARELDFSVTKVSGIVSFYSYFTDEIQGEHIIEVCVGTSCYVNESQEILEKVCEITNCEPDSTSKNKKYSVIVGRCLGKCATAPNIIINEHDVYDMVKLTELKDILSNYK